MIAKFLAYLKHQKRYSQHTIAAYEHDLCAFAKWIGGESELLNSTHADVRSWLLQLLEEKKSQATVHRKMSGLKSFYRYQVQQGNTESNPVLLLTLPKKSKRLPTFLKDKETSELFEQIQFPKTFGGVRDKMILNLFYTTGMRVSELAALQTTSIDYNRKLVKVRGKRNKERIIPLLPFLISSLRDYTKYREQEVGVGDFLFTTLQNKPLNRGQIYYIVRKYLSKVTNALQRSPHVLRHTFATQLLNRGADLNALKELLGHNSLAATQIYTHTTKEQLKKDYKQAHPRA